MTRKTFTPGIVGSALRPQQPGRSRACGSQPIPSHSAGSRAAQRGAEHGDAIPPGRPDRASAVDPRPPLWSERGACSVYCPWCSSWPAWLPPRVPRTSRCLPMTPDQARAAIQVLNDPKQRAALTAALEEIARSHIAPPAPSTAAPPPAATPAAATPAAKPALPIPLAPDSLGAQVLLRAAHFLNHSSTRVVEAAQAARSVPQLWDLDRYRHHRSVGRAQLRPRHGLASGDRRDLCRRDGLRTAARGAPSGRRAEGMGAERQSRNGSAGSSRARRTVGHE